MTTHKCKKCGGWINCGDEPLFVGGQNLEDPTSDFYGGKYRACKCPVVGKEYPLTLVGGQPQPAGSGGDVIITTKANYSGGYLSAGEQPLKAEVQC